MLEVDINKRISANDALQTPFFKNNNHPTKNKLLTRSDTSMKLGFKSNAVQSTISNW